MGVSVKDNGEPLNPDVSVFFDEDSNTYSYVVKDPSSTACAIIDSVLDFDYASGTISYEGADALIQHVKENNLAVAWHIETHVHADHLSAAPYLQEKLGGKLAIGEMITVVQDTFATVFNEGTEFQRDGSQFDRLLSDGEQYQIGNMTVTAWHTPGHTPACMTHLIGDAAFVGDTLFMPDAGTARADFPGGDAATLYQSAQRLLSLPDDTRLFMCHDYGTESRGCEYLSSVVLERDSNIHVNNTIDQQAFVALREARDATLNMPRLILPALQVNMRAGHFPAPESNDLVYLKIPINAFK